MLEILPGLRDNVAGPELAEYVYSAMRHGAGIGDGAATRVG